MPIGDTKIEYSINFEQITSAGGSIIGFESLVDTLGEDVGFNGTKATSDLASFSTVTVKYIFSDTAVTAWLANNSKNAYIEFRVEYDTEADASSYSYNMNVFFSDSNSVQNIKYYISDHIATKADENIRKSAKIRIYAADMPSASMLKNPKFGINIYFNCTNPQSLNTRVTLYEISWYFESATNGSYLVAYNEKLDKYALLEESLTLASVSKDVSAGAEIRLYNFGDTNVFFDANGITSDGSNFVFNPRSDQTVNTVTPNSFLPLYISYSGNVYGATYSTAIRSVCTAYNILDNRFVFNLNFQVLQQATGTLYLEFEGTDITADQSLVLSAYPLDVISKASITIKNNGNQNLIINSIQFNNSITRAEDCVADSTTLAVGQSNSIKFYVDVASLGTKTAQIVINTSDVNNTQKILDLIYNIKDQFKVVFKSGPSYSSTNDSLENNVTKSLGIVDKARTLKKSYSLQNDGVYKSVIINSITVNSVDLRLSNLPSFPYTLQIKNGNILNFDVDFNTATSGLKSGILNINYSEGNP